MSGGLLLPSDLGLPFEGEFVSRTGHRIMTTRIPGGYVGFSTWKYADDRQRYWVGALEGEPITELFRVANVIERVFVDDLIQAVGIFYHYLDKYRGGVPPAGSPEK